MEIIETAIMTSSTGLSVGALVGLIGCIVVGVIAAVILSVCRKDWSREVLILTLLGIFWCIIGAVAFSYQYFQEVEQEVYHVQLTDMSEEELYEKYDVLGHENGYWIIKVFDKENKENINDAKSESTNEQIPVSTNIQEWRVNDIPGAFDENKGISWGLKYDSKTLNVYIVYHQGYGFGITEYKSERGYPYKYNPETQELEEYVPEYIQQLLDAQN